VSVTTHKDIRHRDHQPAPWGEQIGVTPLGVPIYAGGLDLTKLPPAPLRPAPSEEEWREWWRAVRSAVLDR
jgi:hypothetical protein